MSRAKCYPLDDGIVDEVAVERRIKGEKVILRPAEQREAVRRLHAQGYGPGTIARRLHFSTKTTRIHLDEIGAA